MSARLVFEEKETGTPGRRRPTNNKEGGARAQVALTGEKL
jgi:hypothetical protein